MREVVTPAGWLVIGTAVVGLLLGFIFDWIEFLIAGLAATVLLVLAVPFLLGAKGYEVNLVVQKDRVVVGEPLPTQVFVKNVRKSPVLSGNIDLPIGDGIVEVPVPALLGGAVAQKQVDVSTVKRGIVDVGPPSVTKGDPLGLIRNERTWEDKKRVFIHPLTVTLPSTATGFVRDLEGNPTVRLVNDDLAFHAIREYMPGDAQRQVHWKSTAKTGRLMVRQFEETKRSEMLIVLDTRIDSYEDDEEFELAVSAAASLGLRGIRDGRDLQVVTGTELTPFSPLDARGINRLKTITPRALLDDMAGVRSAIRVASIENVVGEATERGDSVSIAVIVLGSQVDISEVRTAALSLPLGIPVIVVIADSFRKPGVRRLASIPVLSIGILEDLRHLMIRGVQ
jgi:Uncharacterized conserved protein (some members contain a von Willebrand factor type A (vWA) domain)